MPPQGTPYGTPPDPSPYATWQVLDSLRHQCEMQGSVAAAFRKLEVSKDSTISSWELKHAMKQRFNIEMSEQTLKGVMREFDIDGDG